MENKTNDFNFNIEELFNNIELVCPVFKLNFYDNQKNCLFGSILGTLTVNELEQYLGSEAMMEDLNDTTILFFDRRHIIETISIMYGMSKILVDNNYISIDKLDAYILSSIETLYAPIRYSAFKNICADICESLINDHKVPKEYVDRMGVVMKYIWFIPYNKLDDISNTQLKRIKDELNKMKEESASNE